MKPTKQFFSILIVVFLLISLGCSQDQESSANTNPNSNLTVFTNQTGDLNANALQAQYIDEQNGGTMNIYGTFNNDGTPKQISNIRYIRHDNDTIVNFIINEQTGKLVMAIVEVNGQRLNTVTEFTSTGLENELIISFYNHDWNNGTSDLLYSAKYTKDGTSLTENPIFISNKNTSDVFWGTFSVIAGFSVAELALQAGLIAGTSPLGTGALAVAAGASGTVIAVGVTTTLVILSLDAIIGEAGASELSPQDIPYPEDTIPNNPIEGTDVPILPENPCVNSTITLNLGIDPGNEIVAIATGGDGGPYTFYWSTGETTTANTYTSIFVQEEGFYSAIVVDGIGCAAIATIEVGGILLSGNWTINESYCLDGALTVSFNSDNSFNILNSSYYQPVSYSLNGNELMINISYQDTDFCSATNSNSQVNGTISIYAIYDNNSGNFSGTLNDTWVITPSCSGDNGGNCQNNLTVNRN